jgi:hypothetical protein
LRLFEFARLDILGSLSGHFTLLRLWLSGVSGSLLAYAALIPLRI